MHTKKSKGKVGQSGQSKERSNKAFLQSRHHIYSHIASAAHRSKIGISQGPHELFLRLILKIFLPERHRSGLDLRRGVTHLRLGRVPCSGGHGLWVHARPWLGIHRPAWGGHHLLGHLLDGFQTHVPGLWLVTRSVGWKRKTKRVESRHVVR